MTASLVVRGSGQHACCPCLGRLVRPSSVQTLYRSSIHTRRKLHGSLVPDRDVQKQMLIRSQPSFHDYFSANNSIDRGWLKNGLLAAWRTAAESPREKVQEANTDGEKTSKETSSTETEPRILEAEHTAESAQLNSLQQPSSEAHSVQAGLSEALPHRRRKLLREEERAATYVPSKTTASPKLGEDATQEQQLPLDASSQLTTAATALPSSATIRRKLATYLSLSKPRLSFLIILTTTSAYSLYPIPEILSSATSTVEATSTLSTSTLTLLFLTTGTFLSCASANAFNMLFEPKYDALMTRTRNRPLVRKLISRGGALGFAVLCGMSGLALLHFGTNPTVATLSGLNIFLYGFVYTPMKRLSWWNTWVGAIVGGIPPLMGWTAAAGQAATSEHHSLSDLLFSEESLGGWLLAGLLFAWQFPHFNSLSHTIREDYRNAGHKMLAWVNPARNARVALRYSLAMFPLCFGLYWAGLVNPGFLALSTACNLWMTQQAIRFWKYQGAKGSARGLFWASVWQLPLVLVGALVCKTGIWDGVFGSESTEVGALRAYDDDDDDGEEEAGYVEDGPDSTSLRMDPAPLPPRNSTG